MDKPKKILDDFIAAKNLRNTPERHIILEEIYSKDAHFDADDLYIRIHNNYPENKISKASIYRNLPLFVEADLLRESLHESGRTIYEHTIGHTHHDHLKCVKCGRVIEFSDKRIDKAQDEVCKNNRFRMTSHLHVISGVCSKCRN